jgi:crotonobetainyl-CoA:carnitine CoA-transferase CaiB-like acyl-CoA transferase
MDQPPSRSPLEGLLVADFSRILAGPLASQTLADLGADIVKVERPGLGDDTRTWGPPWDGDMATYFAGLNRSKRSVTLDLTLDTDRALAFELCRRADVVIENFRPGTMHNLGLGVAEVRAANPSVIYCSISGFGSRGEAASLPGVDLIIQAMAGWMDVTGQPDGPPTKVGMALVDVLAALNATTGILAALHTRHRDGRGDHIEVSLFDAALAGLVNQASGHVLAGDTPHRNGNRHPSIAPYEPIRTADRPVVIAAVNDRLFAKTCSAIARPDLVDDIRFATNPDRRANADELIASLEETLVTRPADHWIHLLTDAGVPVGPVNTVEQAFAWANAMGLEPTTEVDGWRSVRSPIRFADHDTAPGRRAPELGEHDEQIRTWLTAPEPSD